MVKKPFPEFCKRVYVTRSPFKMNGKNIYNNLITLNLVTHPKNSRDRPDSSGKSVTLRNVVTGHFGISFTQK
jgi:hypothetical protein